jgi:hypothetical protein
VANDIEARLSALENVEAIKRMHQSYIDCLDRMAFDEALTYFSSECTAELCDSGVRRGIEEVTKLYHEMDVERAGIRDGHFAVEPNIAVHGDAAEGSWTIFILGFVPTVQWVRGRQHCTYVKVDGTWKFKTLKFQRVSASDKSLLF